jgi:molybdopterin-guanine dinucleotide biosynthesis protein A
MLRRKAPVGVILAGGRGTRMGGSKLTVNLRGRPLIEYPLQALSAALPQVAVIAKPEVELPALPGVTLWLEPAQPHHPLVGVVEALAMADGRPIVTCPADLPFITPGLITRIAETPAGGAPAVVAAGQPLVGCYQPAAAELLQAAARAAVAPVRQAVAAIEPVVVEVDDDRQLFNVNSPEDLLLAAAMLDQPTTASQT